MRKDNERITRWQEHDKTVPITIETRVPEKWLFIDRETGDVWCWRKGKLVRPEAQA